MNLVYNTIILLSMIWKLQYYVALKVFVAVAPSKSTSNQCTLHRHNLHYMASTVELKWDRVDDQFEEEEHIEETGRYVPYSELDRGMIFGETCRTHSVWQESQFYLISRLK